MFTRIKMTQNLMKGYQRSTFLHRKKGSNYYKLIQLGFCVCTCVTCVSQRKDVTGHCVENCL